METYNAVNSLAFTGLVVVIIWLAGILALQSWKRFIQPRIDRWLFLRNYRKVRRHQANTFVMPRAIDVMHFIPSYSSPAWSPTELEALERMKGGQSCR